MGPWALSFSFLSKRIIFQNHSQIHSLKILENFKLDRTHVEDCWQSFSDSGGVWRIFCMISLTWVSLSVRHMTIILFQVCFHVKCLYAQTCRPVLFSLTLYWITQSLHSVSWWPLTWWQEGCFELCMFKSFTSCEPLLPNCKQKEITE